MFNRKKFLAEVEYVLKAIEKKTTIPVLAGIHIATRNGICQLTGTDLEIAAVSGFPLDVPDFSMVANAHGLRDTLKSIKAESVALLRTDTGGIAVSEVGGSFTSTVDGFDSLSYPELPGGMNQQLLLPSSSVVDLTSAVRRSISKKDGRFTMNGALMTVDRGELRFVATDGHRMSIGESVTALPGKLRHLVHSSVLAILPLMVNGGESVLVCENEAHISFLSVSGTTARGILQRKMKGNFPDWQRVTPKSENLPYRFTIERAGLLAKVAALSKFTDERSHYVHLGFAGDGTVAIMAKNDAKQTEDSLPVAGHGPVGIAFNLSYLVDALQTMDCDAVELQIKDKGSAMMMLGTNGSAKVSTVIMPMRS